MKRLSMDEMAVRIAAFDWLRENTEMNAGVFSGSELQNKFFYKGERITLKGATGIWTPKGFSAPISITTVSDGPYPDSMNDQGLLEYKYRGRNPNHRDNLGLRAAYKSKIPLIYFYGIKPGRFNAYWPVYIIHDEPRRLRVMVDLAESAFGEISFEELKSPLYNLQDDLMLRRYTTVLIKQRMHQAAFRQKVISAYRNQCTVCSLRHRELLDAAHIIPDKELEGDPIISNGLSLCKIHHSAYDKKIIGISPDYKVKVREDVLKEEDGDMLKYGLQANEGALIKLPTRKIHYPDRERLEIAFNRFLGV